MVAAKGEVLRMLVMALLLLFNTISCTSGNETYLVGDDDGWVSCCTDYSVWAAKYKFYVGDVLVFVFNSLSNVAEVDEKGYHECLTRFSGSVYTESPVNITLNSTGYKYYISTGKNCKRQSLAINVAGDGSPSPSPDKSPPPPPSVSLTNGTTDQSAKDSSDSEATRNKIIGAVVGPIAAALVAALINELRKFIERRKQKKEEQKQQEASAKPGDQKVPGKPAAPPPRPVIVNTPVTIRSSSSVDV